ncbi:hypothetical protein J5I95_20855 [Candidatus Poribacteria bacterium]|nr:hypothetical protein [Candidatus Poribacteria bacterium]
MKTLVLNGKKLVQMLTTFVLTLCVSSILWVMPTFATEFEFGTQFGISHLRPEGNDYYSTNITYTRFPSGTFLDVGSAPTSLYATWFPSKQFAIGPEFSFGRTSVSASYGGESETESITTLHLGGKASYFLLSHAVSSPYVLGRVSLTIFSGDGDDEILTSFGAGAGYQWRIDTAFVLRVEGQYQRLLVSDDDDANEFSLTIGIGTRFGNSNNPQ